MIKNEPENREPVLVPVTSYGTVITTSNLSDCLRRNRRLINNHGPNQLFFVKNEDTCITQFNGKRNSYVTINNGHKKDKKRSSLTLKGIVFILIMAVSIMGMLTLKHQYEKEAILKSYYPRFEKQFISAIDYLEPLSDINELTGQSGVTKCRIYKELQMKEWNLYEEMENAKIHSLRAAYSREKYEQNKLVRRACEDGQLLYKQQLYDHMSCLVQYSELHFGRLPQSLNKTQSMFIINRIMDGRTVQRPPVDCSKSFTWYNEKVLMMEDQESNHVLVKQIRQFTLASFNTCLAAHLFDSSAPICPKRSFLDSLGF